MGKTVVSIVQPGLLLKPKQKALTAVFVKLISER